MKNRLMDLRKSFNTETRRTRSKTRKQFTENSFKIFTAGSKSLSCKVLISPLLRCSVLFALVFFVYGCTLAKVDVNVVSERTSLENQVLGTYNSLNEDMLLVASVRGVSPTGKIDTPPRHSPEQLDATRAMETIAFHADDIETFKRFGWVGENQDGLLTPFTREVPKVAAAELKSFAANYSEAEFQQVVKEVNLSRETLMMRVVQTNENFTSKDLPAIRKVFAKLNRQNSAPGSRVQEPDGRWSTL
ncbi:MAG: DUF1318 domain-containing protein [Deltaproteobacteria bacterium]|nr:DUF1318 domain-containing protein [Deltaproteobacteria bacterium]